MTDARKELADKLEDYARNCMADDMTTQAANLNAAAALLRASPGAAVREALDEARRDSKKLARELQQGLPKRNAAERLEAMAANAYAALTVPDAGREATIEAYDALKTVTIVIPSGYKNATEFLKDCEFQEAESIIEQVVELVEKNAAKSYWSVQERLADIVASIRALASPSPAQGE